MSKKLLLALTASSVLFATPAFAIHNGWSSPPPTQGGSTNDCNTNPGCLTTSEPKGQVGKEGNSSPKECSGPAGQCK
jgi:hypothetical protein